MVSFGIYSVRPNGISSEFFEKRHVSLAIRGIGKRIDVNHAPAALHSGHPDFLLIGDALHEELRAVLVEKLGTLQQRVLADDVSRRRAGEPHALARMGSSSPRALPVRAKRETKMPDRAMFASPNGINGDTTGVDVAGGGTEADRQRWRSSNR